ncbi:MAG: DUF1538 domain-containing protein [Oscillospiraceae bacterium]|nr:DUF1538 domain-containing protein [Oscillospiraceae bacterium]
MKKFKTIMFDNFSESIRAALPVILIIIVLAFSIAPMPNNLFLSFIVGAAMLVAGMGLFNLGVQTAMTPIGEGIGTFITKSRNMWVMIAVTLTIGIFITVAEPDLQVLASQIPSVPNPVVVVSVAVGVGLFLVVSILRMLLYIPISRILIGCYAAIFVLAIFVPNEYLAIAFDASGVTTGPMTVPFIVSIGIGVAAIRSDKHATNDSFGLVGISSIGPILSVMILGFLYDPGSSGYGADLAVSATENSREVWLQFTDISTGLPHFLIEVLIALAPIAAFFLVFQFVSFKLKKRDLLKILIGLVLSLFGLVMFLTGANVGFMPAGYFLGDLIAGLDYNWIIIPAAMLIGYFIVSAEPAVHILNKTVEEVSSGAIPYKAMQISLSIGVCVSMGLSMIRMLFGIHVMWFLIPGFTIALALSFFVPKMFTAIAFDSGGAASGPMTATFLLPFGIGVCSNLSGRTITDAFGVVAMVAMTPLITIQIMGFIYKLRLKTKTKTETQELGTNKDDGIIE